MFSLFSRFKSVQNAFQPVGCKNTRGQPFRHTPPVTNRNVVSICVFAEYGFVWVRSQSTTFFLSCHYRPRPAVLLTTNAHVVVGLLSSKGTLVFTISNCGRQYCFFRLKVNFEYIKYKCSILMFSLHLLNVANISTQQTPFSWLRVIPICFSAYHPTNIPISANSHLCAKNLQAFFSPDSHFYEFPFYRERTVCCFKTY